MAQGFTQRPPVHAREGIFIMVPHPGVGLGNLPGDLEALIEFALTQAESTAGDKLAGVPADPTAG